MYIKSNFFAHLFHKVEQKQQQPETEQAESEQQPPPLVVPVKPAENETTQVVADQSKPNTAKKRISLKKLEKAAGNDKNETATKKRKV